MEDFGRGSKRLFATDLMMKNDLEQYGADLKRLSATYMMMKNDLELSLHTVKLEILLV